MRIDPTGYGDYKDGIMAVICDKVFFTLFEQNLTKPFSVWANKHEDGTYTVHYSYDGISDAGLELDNPIYIENPMTAFANATPIINRVLEGIKNSGIV